MGRIPAQPQTAGDHREHPGAWQVSLHVPTIGIVLLAVLWLLSAFDGWAASAFCSGHGAGGACRAHVAAAVRPSTLVAAAAALLAVAALVPQSLLRSGQAARLTRLRLLAASAVGFVAALAVLFVAGEAATH